MEYNELDIWAHRSVKIENITKAMIAFQLSLKEVLRKEDKGQFAYAKLETILFHILPKLNAVDIDLEQPDFTYKDNIYLRTIVTHSSGEFKASFDYLYPESAAKEVLKSVQEAGNLQKALGCVKTYQCRYALKNFLCLPIMDPDFDDDPYLSKIQVGILIDLANNDDHVLTTLENKLKIKDWNQIPKDDFDKAVSIIKKEQEGK